MRFLVSAYGCEPNKGSEPGIGWQWGLQLAKLGEVWIITRTNNEENINTGLKTLPDEIAKRLHFTYYDTNKVIRSIKKGDLNLYPYYFCWQLGAYKKAKELCQRIKFDYCIALTFGSIWMPTFMHKLNVPFIWGPIGGGEAVPDEYLDLMGKKYALLQKFRKVLKKTAMINPLVGGPARKAKYIVTRTSDTAEIFPSQLQKKVSVCLETSIDASEIVPKEDYTVKEHITLIFSGRLIKIKGLEFILRALARIKTKYQYRFLVIGSGSEKEKLAKLASELGVSSHVVFAGKMTREALLDELRNGDIYVFPSLKEGGSRALMEGMACGLPVVCLDASGMHVITDDTCACRVPIADIEATIDQYAKALSMLIDDPHLREKMGSAARKRILSEFNWNAKGEFLKQLLD